MSSKVLGYMVSSLGYMVLRVRVHGFGGTGVQGT